jgi:hypothetical protein
MGKLAVEASIIIRVLLIAKEITSKRISKKEREWKINTSK